MLLGRSRKQVCVHDRSAPFLASVQFAGAEPLADYAAVSNIVYNETYLSGANDVLSFPCRRDACVGI